MRIVVQLEVSPPGQQENWADHLYAVDREDGDKAFDETVADYPHRKVRLVERVTTENVVRRNFL